MKNRKNLLKFIAWTSLALVLAGCVADVPGSGSSDPSGSSVHTTQTTPSQTETKPSETGESVPESSVPESSVPETSVPETTVPETTVPPTQPQETQPPTTEPTQPVTTVPPETEPAGSSIVFVTWPETISRGSEGTITIKGEPNTTYSIAVYYKSGPSSAKGLEDKVSDADGYVTWTWKVSSRTSTGDFKIVVTGGGESVEVPYSVVE